MTDKLEALSQPVAYTLRFKNDDGTPGSRINTNTTFSNKEAAQGYGKGGRYKTRPDGKMEWVRDKALDPDVVSLYSQEYVTALLAALEEKDQRIAELQQRLQQPIKLPDVLFIKISGQAVAVMSAIAIKERIRAAGHKVEGE
ncbi:hypothetical protein [Serratia fonticola]